jgi:hypothetical protein
MYEIRVPYKNFKQQPKNGTVQFNLEVNEVMHNFIELAWILEFRDKFEKLDGDIPNELMVEFFDNFESVLLAAWGVMSDDGEHFRKGGMFDFKESKLFSATMNHFITDFQALNVFLNNLLPPELEEIVKKQTESLEKLKKDNPNMSPEEIEAQIEKLRAMQVQTSEGERSSE